MITVNISRPEAIEYVARSIAEADPKLEGNTNDFWPIYRRQAEAAIQAIKNMSIEDLEEDDSQVSSEGQDGE